jgi:hypothetical protein
MKAFLKQMDKAGNPDAEVFLGPKPYGILRRLFVPRASVTGWVIRENQANIGDRELTSWQESMLHEMGRWAPFELVLSTEGCLHMNDRRTHISQHPFEGRDNKTPVGRLLLPRDLDRMQEIARTNNVDFRLPD